MDFQLTDDQRAIADMAGSLFGDLCTDDRLRAFDTAGEGTAAQRVHARRLAARDIHDPIVVKKLFDVIGGRFQARNGGYTRIVKLGHRAGDNADVALIELVGYEYKAKEKKDTKGAAPAAAPKEATK